MEKTQDSPALTEREAAAERNRAALESLDEKELETLLASVGAYAHWVVRGLQKNLGRLATPPGVTADDVVMEALELFLTGRRKWKPEECPDLAVYLKGVVRSLLSNWRDRAEFKVRIDTTEIDDPDEEEGPTTADPRLRQRVEDEFDRILQGSQELMTIKEGRMEGWTRQQIADEFEMTPEEVTNATKRFCRKVLPEFDHDLLREVLA